MDPKIMAATIGALAGFVGVVVGGYIQVLIKDRELLKEKRSAEGAVCLYLCHLRSLFDSFSTEDSAYQNLALGIAPNDNNFSELEIILDIIKGHDPFVLIQIFDVKQRLHNIRSYAKDYHRIVKEDGSHKEFGPIVGMLLVDAKGGLKDIDLCIKYTFNRSERETKSYLLKTNEFRLFLPKLLGESWIVRTKIKLGIVKKI